MNKIFKVIWSKSKQCYVVVSEMAKNTTGKKKIIVASILATLAMQTVSITNVQAINESGTGTQASVAIGYGSQSKGTTVGSTVNPSVAVGTGSYAEGNSALALGTRSWAKGSYNVSVGREATSSQDYGIAVGYQANVSAIHGMALGERAAASGQIAVAVGANARATGTNSFAGGFNSASGGTSSVALGESATSSGETSVAIGKNTVASDGDAVSIGTSSQATGADSVALGKNAKASNGDTIAIGQDSVADLLNGVALGKTSKATGASATALGPQSTASATYAAAIGMNSVANQEYATAIGGSSQATVQRGVALGAYSVASTASGVAGYDANANRTNKYAGLTGKALTSSWGAVSIGDGTNTRQITGLAAGTKDTDAVNVAQLKSVNLAFTGDNNSSGDVNLVNSKLAITGDNTYITTAAANQGLTIKAKKETITVSNGTASANIGVADARNVADAINQANAEQKISYKANNDTAKSVKLSDGLKFTDGTSTVATVGNNGQVTYDLNGATKKSISDSEAAVKRHISLGADSGTASSQSLSSNHVDFNVKGGNGSFISTSMSGNTVLVNTTRGTIHSDSAGNASLSGNDGLATAQNVATAINQAKAGAAWKLSANNGGAETISGGDTVDFANGNNIEVSRSSKKITIKTKDDMTVNSLKANNSLRVGNDTTIDSSGIQSNSVKTGNTTMNTSGLTISGGPSVTTAGINAGNKAITSVGSGLGNDSNAATVGDVKSLVNGLGSNSFKLMADSTSTTAQALNKSGGLSFKVAGDSDLISTSATGDTVKVSISKGSLTNNTDGTVNANKAGVATTGDVATAVNDAVAKATGAQGLTITDGTHNGKINLKTQSLAITGTNGVDATVNNQNLTVGLNTATKTAIDNAQTAVNRTISLGADSGTASSQSLKDGNVAFNVKGKTGDYITTAMNGNTVEISTTRATINSNASTGATSVTGADGLVTAKNVSDAINKAAEAAKSGAAWNLTTNSSASNKTLVQGGDTVDLVNGDNIEISQDGTNKKKVTIKTKKDLTVDSIVANKSVTIGSGTNQIRLDGTTGAVTGNTFAGNSFTAGNSVLNTTGFHITGGPSVTAAGIDAGNKAITNVASGLGNDSNAATVGDVKGLVDGVGKNTFTLAADTTSTTAQALNKSGGLSFKVAGDSDLISTSATGNTVTVSISKGSLTNNTDGTVNANKAGVATTGDVATAVNDAVAKATESQGLTITDGANTGKVNLKTQSLNIIGTNGVDATVNNQTVTVGLNTATKTAIDNAQTAVNRTISLGADSGTVSSQSLKDGNVAFNVKGKTGDYITTAMNGNTVEVSTQQATLSNNATTGAATVTGNDGLVTAKNVADTINAVADKIKTSAAWKLTTNSSATDVTDVKSGDTVDFVNGDNIEISQDGTNKKKVTIKTKKDLTVDSVVANKSVTVGSGTNQIGLDGTTGAVSGNTFAGNSFTAGNSVLNTTGFHITGGPSVTAAGIDAGNKAITNVASGGTTRSNAATVGDVQDAVANLSQNLNITDGTNNGTVDLKTQKLNVAGANGVTATVNNQTITVGLDTNVVNATTKGIGLTGDTGATGNKYLKDGDVSFAVTGDSNLVSTKATAAGVQVSVDASKIKDLAVGAVTVSKDTTQTDNPITVTPTTGTNAKDYAIGIDTAKLATKTDFTYRANNDTDANAKKVSLAKGLNFVNGTGTEATVGTDGTVSFGLDTATKTAIDNAQTAVNRTISLGADSGTASSQSLKDGNVAFDVKGKTGDYITTAMNGSTVEISTTRATINSNATTGAASVTGADGLVTAKNVSDAINKAAEAAKSGAAWNLTTNSSTTDTTLVQGGDTVDLVNGDNIEISQDGTNKKKVTIKTKKDLTVDSIVANKSVTVGSGTNQINLDGTTGAVSGNTFAGNSFTAGNSVLNTTGFHITGGPSVTATGIDAGNKAITNVASGGTTRSNAATVGDVQDAVANLSQNLNITDGTNNGTVDLKTQKLNVAGANGVTATVNNQTITVGLDTATKTAIDNAQTAVNRTISLGADSGTVSSQSLKDGNVAFNVKGKTGDYITTAMNGNTVEISTQQATLSNNATTGDATVTGNDGLVTAKNVADTINAVADKIKTSSAWKLTTNSSTTDVTDVKSGDTVDLVNGDNIEISQDSTNKKKVTIKTKKDLTVDSIVANKSITVGSGANQISLDGTTGAVSGNTFAGNSFTAGNSVLNTTGFHITGGPSVTAAGIDAGNKAITNVASGLGNDSNAATVGDVKGLVDGVGNNTFTLTADTTSTTAQSLNKSGGLSFKVAGDSDLISTSATGNTVTVSISKGSLTNNTDGTVNANKAGVATTGDVATAVNTAVAKATGAQELTITDGTTDGTINLKNQKLNVAGANGVTATVNNQTITVGLDTNVVNATTKGIGLTGDTGTTGNKYLKDGDVSFAVTGDSNLVSTKATAAGVQVSVDASKIKDLAVGAVTVSKDTTQTDNPITVTPTTGTNAKDYAIGIDTAKLATKTDFTYRANNDTDANAKKVSLAKGLNFVNGTGTEATVGTDGTVSFGLDTATKTAIDNAQTAVNRTISLGADSGTASSQSLKDGNVAFDVKGKTGDYITTAMNGSTVEISTTRATINSNATTGAASVTGADGLVTAKNVSDAINKAAEAAKSGAAWNLTTNSSTTDTTLVQGGDTVDLVNGDNIEISQDGTNKKKVTIKTKKDLTVDSIVANKSVTVGSGANQITLNGTTGAIQGNTFAGNSFTAGNSVLNTTGFHITGGPSVTAAGIDAGNKAITNVASGGTTRSNAATVGDVQDAVANLSQNLNITDGTNNGTVDLKTQKLNVAGANGVTATVNNQTITVGLDTNVVNATTKGIGLTGDTGATGNKYLKDGDVSFAVTGDSNLVSTKATTAGVQVSVDASKIKDLAVGAVTVSKD
uniref:ESPR-type extended signal peptide-containing protein n=1 Tax=uncultured Veillonella sp. TaxID=159268 RepID=UPI0025D6286C